MSDNERAALVIIDLGRSVLESGIARIRERDAALAEQLHARLNDTVLPNAVRLAEAFRAAGKPVVFVNWASYRTLYPQLGPREGDVVVAKHARGAFAASGLDNELRTRGINACVFAGADTAVCVASTARGAIDRQYKVTMVADACYCGDPRMHDLELEVLRYNGAAVSNTEEVIASCRG